VCKNAFLIKVIRAGLRLCTCFCLGAGAELSSTEPESQPTRSLFK
jgi:hypothetical protein